MVYMNNENDEVEVETTNDDIDLEETELVDVEEKSGDKIKKLQEKLRRAEEEKKEAQDELQRARADFLNARKRLDEERIRDRARAKIAHVEELLPLCDSFYMAMSNKEAWEKADEAWRKGVEGINGQLNRILDSYGVKAIDPQGEVFDPHRDEAIGTEKVTDEKLVDTVVTVVQRGFEMEVDGKMTVIRHARVTTGIMNE
ncbi:nucleotide exchange factor GrpE [Candidatus Kaiserbacteria bacterium]|nr:nucleotide exchange factor GrpE [Candidatus Kaiserbacteria bacterium]USN88732.1 MAG: nucleotide exchange factor GrpE [Candidatus Nomurabacteria bacterium]